MADLMIFSNDASGFLQTGIDVSATTLTLQAGQGAKFPMYSAGQYSICVLEIESAYEVIKIISRSGDVLQIQRAQEGTSAAPFPAGTLVEMRVTSGVLTYLRQLALSSQGETTPYKQPVRVVATSNITPSGLQTIAGISLSIGDRVLLSGQTNLSQNGIYSVQTGAWVRTSDFDGWGKTISALVLVSEGNAKADTVWMCTSNAGNFLMDVDPILFIQLAGDGAVLSNVVMTGYNTSTTGNQNDVSSQIATNAFVKRSGKTFGGVSVKTASAGLTTTSSGSLIVLDPSCQAGTTMTLPVASTVPVGTVITFMSMCGIPIVVDVNRTAPADLLLVDKNATGLLTGITLNSGDTLEVTSNTGSWIATAGSRQLKYSTTYKNLSDDSLINAIVFGG